MLEESVYDALKDALISETFETIDLLAGKGYEIDGFIEDEEMEVESITSEKITVKFSGGAPVTLHYGSRDDAAQVSHTFPFWMRFVAPVNNPADLTLKDYSFDDTSWYE